MVNYIQKMSLFLVIASLVAIMPTAQASELNFDPDNITQVSFPKDFLFGVIQQAPNPTANNQVSDAQLLKLVQPLSVNAVQLEVNWCTIEPHHGQFNYAELERIAKKCQELKNAGYKVALTLHHFYRTSQNDPEWFSKWDGFEKEENSAYFIAFAKKVFEYVGEHVDMICTFHQPAGYAIERFYRGIVPPYKKSLQLALDVLKNMLDTHVLTYAALKNMKHGDKVKIGIVHQVVPMEPYYAANPLDQLAASMAHRLHNQLVIDFFATGKLNFVLPFSGKKFFIFAYLNHYNERAVRSLDFFGLCYMSHIYLKNFSAVKDPDSKSTDHELFTVYPQGLYDTITYVAQLGVPIHVLGNGIADVKDLRREEFLKQHIYAVSQAVNQGYDVRSYFYRFLEDDQYDPLKFGLYAIDPQSLQRYLRPSAAYLVKVAAEHQKKYEQAAKK